MRLAQGNKLAVIIELVAIFRLVGPVDGVDVIGTLEGIVDTLLVAPHLLAGKHERSALRGEDDGLGQACGALTVGLGAAGHRLGQLT